MAVHTIDLDGSQIREEGVMTVAGYPGYLVMLDSNAGIKPHATEGDYAERAVLLENALAGGIVSDQYAIAARAFYALAKPGSRMRMMLNAGEVVTRGEQLISAGDGTLKSASAVSSGVTVKQIIAVADEDKDLSASGAVDTLIDVRIL